MLVYQAAGLLLSPSPFSDTSESSAVMLIKKQLLNGIADGRISLAFRRWKRPTVKKGGRLRTIIGVLAIDAVDEIDVAKITRKDATRAGYSSREELLAELNKRTEGKLYRITLRYAGEDPRLALRRQDNLSDEEIDDLRNRLARMDLRTKAGPWTSATLNLIARNPGKRAPDLAERLGMETKRFKANVRKLKELGITESLKVGYRLSPRGKVVFDRLKS